MEGHRPQPVLRFSHLGPTRPLQRGGYDRQLILNRGDDLGGDLRRSRELVSERYPPPRREPDRDVVRRPMVSRRSSDVSLDVVSTQRAAMPLRNRSEVDHPGIGFGPTIGMVRPPAALGL